MLRQLTAAVALATLVACAGNKTEAPVADAGDVADEAAAEKAVAAAETADATSEKAEAAAETADATSEKAVAATETAAELPLTFGESIGDATTTPVAIVLKDPTAFADQELVIEGEIRQVCQKMGCWFEMSAGPDVKSAIRVTSPGHDILIPTDSSGKTAVAKGTLTVREVTEEEAEHYRSEGAQAEAGMELTLKMTGVTLK